VVRLRVASLLPAPLEPWLPQRAVVVVRRRQVPRRPWELLVPLVGLPLELAPAEAMPAQAPQAAPLQLWAAVLPWQERGWRAVVQVER
jgi:hypothetical protein